MADIVASKSVSIQTLMGNLDLYKYNPSALQRVVLDYLDEVTEGAVNVVDPTSPFVFLLESSAVNTAIAVNEALSILPKQYPDLAQTESDLYRHMSDKDYINRFASPSKAVFTISMNLPDVQNKMVWDPTESCYKATFPRDSKFVVGEYTFTLLYPIDIRKYESGMIQISYDPSIASPIDDLQSNIITPLVRYDASQVGWLFFDVPVYQFAIASTNYPLQAAQVFSQDIQYTDQFYLMRAYYRNTATGDKWVEINVTHTDQVYDLNTPTTVAKVFTGYVNVTIPMLYLDSGVLTGEIRFDIYTSKGSLTVNLSNYKVSEFQLLLQPVDEERDLNEFTAAMADISYYPFSRDLVTGGANAIDFATLRQRVIMHSTGPQIIPITPTQAQAKIEANGFTLVKNIDTITNRIFLATQKLPKPMNEKLATSANIGISPFVTNMAFLQTLDTVASNGERCTILSSNLYLNNNGILVILTSAQIAALKSMAKSDLVVEVNSKKYLYSPYYYVLDDSDNEFAVRAYDLDYPLATDLSFISQNQTLKLPVNTGSYSIAKIPGGYRLSIITASGNYYKQLDDGTVFAQLAYYPVGETRMAYINGVLAGTDATTNERMWTFDILTNYDLNSADNLTITNASMFGTDPIDNWINLEHQFHIFHATTSIDADFVPDDADALLGKFLLPDGAVANTHETLDLQLGLALKALWTRSRSFAAGQDYQRYQFDVPMYYEDDVYDIDPVTGSIFKIENEQIVYLKLHSAGDPVLDNEGNQIYKHKKGDVVLDANGKPVVVSDLTVNKEVDMLFVDGRQYFVDDPAFLAYNQELVGVLDSWIVDDVAGVQKTLLEQTRIFFYPKTTLGQVKVFTQDQGQDILPSEQSLNIDLYVKSEVYNDSAVRQQLYDNTVKLLDQYISGAVVNTTEITLALVEMYGNSVESTAMSGLGGEKNYKILSLADEQNRLCLKKILVLQPDGSLIIKEDVTVNFYRIP